MTSMRKMKHWSRRRTVNDFVFSLLLVLVLLTILMMSGRRSRSEIGVGEIYSNVADIPTKVVFDAILILGGGVPSSLEEPPLFVQKRCDDAVTIMSRQDEKIPMLCLSAGSTHVPQLMSPRGLPVWESTASAAYLRKNYQLESNLYVETTSYDTIGNAYFARTSHTDVAGWRRLMIVTNKFHIERSKAIFDWIFSLGKQNYKLYYFASEDVGLSEEALVSRRAHEARGAVSVREKLSKQYTTLRDVWRFVVQKHDLYTATKLIEGANAIPSDEKLAASYGARGAH